MNPIDGEAEARDTYNYYIETIIQFQKLFSYTGSIQSLLDLPYPLFKDLILAKIKDNVAEKEKINKLKNKNPKVKTYGINDRL